MQTDPIILADQKPLLAAGYLRQSLNIILAPRACAVDIKYIWKVINHRMLKAIYVTCDMGCHTIDEIVRDKLRSL